MRLTKALLACSALCASMFLPASADERNGGGNGGDGPDRKIVTVAFGAGLNTNQPGNPDNHHVIPNTIRVNVGDVVSFNVAGFHIIRVYGNGVKLSDVKLEIPDECEVNPSPPGTPFPPSCGPAGVPPIVPAGALAVYYNGINGLVSPQPGPPFAQLSAAANRVEPVSFLQPGRYLVICAVLPHFNDKMYAWIEVRARGNSGNGGHDHD